MERAATDLPTVASTWAPGAPLLGVGGIKVKLKDWALAFGVSVGDQGVFQLRLLAVQGVSAKAVMVDWGWAGVLVRVLFQSTRPGFSASDIK